MGLAFGIIFMITGGIAIAGIGLLIFSIYMLRKGNKTSIKTICIIGIIIGILLTLIGITLSILFLNGLLDIWNSGGIH